MKYTTLNGETLDLTSLSNKEKKIYEEAKQFAKQEPEPEWTVFSNFWIKKIQELNASVDSTIYKLLQDIDSRLGVRQGLTRLPNWREQLELLIASKFKSRNAFCKAAEINQASLSNVIKGKKAFSMPTLIRALDTLGFHMVFVSTEVLPTGEW